MTLPALLMSATPGDLILEPLLLPQEEDVRDEDGADKRNERYSNHRRHCVLPSGESDLNPVINNKSNAADHTCEEPLY